MDWPVNWDYMMFMWRCRGGDHSILFGPRGLPAPSPQAIPSPRPTYAIAKTCTWTQWTKIRIWWRSLGGRGLGPLGRQVEGLPKEGRECTSYLGGSGTNVLGSPPSPAGERSYHLIWAVAAPCHYIHNCLKPMHSIEHPLPTYTMAKNAGLPGVSRGEGWEPRAGEPRVCRSWRRTCTSNLVGYEPMYVKSHLPAPRGGPPPCRPEPDAFKWPQARHPFEEKRRMVEYNRCDWLIIGRTERCGKPCDNRLCGLHQSRLRRKPGSEPHPCQQKWKRQTGGNPTMLKGVWRWPRAKGSSPGRGSR